MDDYCDLTMEEIKDNPLDNWYGRFPGMFDEYFYESGLAIGRGWFTLVEQMLEEIYAISPMVRIHQIKEKFGGLRCYCDDEGPFFNQVHQVIVKYEMIASTTCEKCGATSAKLRTDGWLITQCDQCYNKIKKSNEGW